MEIASSFLTPQCRMWVNLEKRVPERHLLRRINPTVTRILASIRKRLPPSRLMRVNLTRCNKLPLCQTFDLGALR
jgi:hypothetical protein